jgi:hypothetical protein
MHGEGLPTLPVPAVEVTQRNKAMSDAFETAAEQLDLAGILALAEIVNAMQKFLETYGIPATLAMVSMAEDIMNVLKPEFYSEVWTHEN